MSLSGKPSLTTLAPLSNDSFWPDLAMSALVEKYRIPPEYADNVIETGLVLAMIRVNEQLNPVKLAIEGLGFQTLDGYTDAHILLINNTPVLLTHYQHAVFCFAKAFLLKQFNSLNRKAEAESAAKESEQTEQFWLDQSQASIKSLFGVVLPNEAIASQANVYVAAL